MFKSKIMKELINFGDDILSLLGLAFGFMLCLVLVCVAGGFAYYYFPMATEITLWIIGILLIIAPFLPWLEKGLSRLNHALDKRLAAQPPFSLKTWGNEMKQAFKKGMGSNK